MITTLSNLDTIKAKVAAGDAYYKARISEMESSVVGSVMHNPGRDNGVGGGSYIYCGGNNRNATDTEKVIACDWPVEDGIDAFTYALLGYLENNANHPRTALEYIESWTNAANFRGFDPAGLNAPLQHGWTLPWYVNTAEILRHTYSGWQPRHTTMMEEFIARMLPLVVQDSVGAPNNWLHSRIEAHMAAAIFNSDRAMFDSAVSRWRVHTRSYVYIDADNGVPVLPSSSQAASRGAAYWATPRFLAGQTMETCRDIGHQTLGMRSIFNSMAMAINQGVDIVGNTDNGERLATFLEAMPALMQSGQDHPSGICNDPIVVDPSADTFLRTTSTRIPFEIGYKLLASPSRPLLRAKEDIDLGVPTKGSRWVTKWEALTHH